ncbi:MAG: GNAT family N-acetyltransferase [Microscillaceae bacterium]
MIEVWRIETEENQQKAFQIREKVFVEEQKVPPALEYDTHELASRHFLAYLNGQAVGTARWRKTENGIKLERFAVLPEARGLGVGQALVQAVMNDIDAHRHSAGYVRYLHAQKEAVSLYARFGFEIDGEEFEEAGIAHFKMIWQNPDLASLNQ